MEDKNFSSDDIKLISYIAYQLELKIQSNELSPREIIKTSFVYNLFIEIPHNPVKWANVCQYTMKHFYSELISRITSFKERQLDSPTDELLIVGLKFYYEYYLFFLKQEKVFFNESIIKSAKSVLLTNRNLFTDIEEEIASIKEELPYLILREFPVSHAQNEIISRTQELQEKLDIANKSIDKKKELAESLAKKFDGISDNYNFAGLHRGFLRMFRDKEREKDKSNYLVFSFGAIVFLITAAAIFIPGFHQISTDKQFSEKLSQLIPFLGAEIISLYFFRLLYTENKSIKSQLLQLRLRMTLCQFIQRYASYVNELGDGKSSLEKFENIIFSGIISDPNNIPSTFDGMDQLGNLIEKFNRPR